MKQLLSAAPISCWQLLTVLVSLLLGFWLGVWLNQRTRKQQREGAESLALLQSLLQGFSRAEPPETAWRPLLQAVARMVHADYYACYLRAGPASPLKLMALLERDADRLEVEIAYGRLTAYEREHYLPPARWEEERLPSEIRLVEEGHHRLLLLPLAAGQGLVLSGPVQRCGPRELTKLRALQSLLRPLCQLIGKKLGNATECMAAPAGGETVVKQPSLPPGQLERLEQLLRLLDRLTQADGSLLVVQQAGGGQLLATTGRQEQLPVGGLQLTAGEFSPLLEQLSAEDELVVTLGSHAYSQLPPAVALLGDQLLLWRLPALTQPALLLSFAAGSLRLAPHQRLARQLLKQQLTQLLTAPPAGQNRSPAQLAKLRALVQANEALDEHASNHGELVAHYALAIAKQLELSSASCQLVARAALLHDVGEVLLPQELFGKPGRYTAEESAELTQHASFGAELVLALTGDEQLARLIRLHHQRYDGRGYPKLEAGDLLPVEASIISLAELFVAKLRARAYRPPLPFGQAIAALQAASGSELDPVVVNGLLCWYAKKSAALADPFQPLAACWVMRCCPIDRRANCAAFHQPEQNCWRIAASIDSKDDVTCATCPVYTEYVYRSRSKR